MLRAVQKRQIVTFPLEDTMNVRGFCAGGGGGGDQQPTRWGQLFKLVAKKSVYDRTISRCGRSDLLIRFMDWTNRAKSNWLQWVNKGEPDSAAYGRANEDFAATYMSAMVWLVLDMGSTGKLVWDWHVDVMTGEKIEKLGKMYKSFDEIGKKSMDDATKNYKSTGRQICQLHLICMVLANKVRAFNKNMVTLENNVETLKVKKKEIEE